MATATNRTVDRVALVEFLRPRHRLIFSTRRADGREQLSPVTAGVDDDGHVVIASYPQRAKVRNLRRDPAASACVLSDEWNGPWVQVSGAAEVVDLPEAVDGLVDYYRSISGEHPDWVRVPPGHGGPGKVPHPPARRTVGAHRHRRLPSGALQGLTPAAPAGISGAATTDEVEEPAEPAVGVTAARFELDLEDQVVGVGSRAVRGPPVGEEVAPRTRRRVDPASASTARTAPSNRRPGCRPRGR